MAIIRFEQNYNNKLNCDIFTTIRSIDKFNELKDLPDEDTVEIFLKDKKQKTSFIKYCKDYLKKAANIASKLLCTENSHFFISTYLSAITELHLNIKLKQIPNLRFASKFDFSKIRAIKRNWV